jgi:DNA-directed RNA polymerase subunit K/omega
MSARSELLFQAHVRISNAFVLCTVISSRTRQLMMSADGNRSTVELVNHALNELLAGVLEFEMHAEKELKSKAPLSYSYLNVACREELEVGAS